MAANERKRKIQMKLKPCIILGETMDNFEKPADNRDCLKCEYNKTGKCFETELCKIATKRLQERHDKMADGICEAVENSDIEGCYMLISKLWDEVKDEFV